VIAFDSRGTMDNSNSVSSEAGPTAKRRRTAEDGGSMQQQMTLSLEVHNLFLTARDALDEHVRFTYSCVELQKNAGIDLTCPPCMMQYDRRERIVKCSRLVL
jgi:hypothetical protein